MKSNNYSKLDKVLHKIILGNTFVGEFLYDLENFIFKKKYTNIRQEKHIFISGYARSGTTLLLQLFAETKNYSTLTYSDMPFILAPNIWRSIFKKKTLSLTQRSHKDLVRINNKSPEAFEEVFWKMICKNSYINDEFLNKNNFEKTNIMPKFENFINQVCLKKTKKIYLSKNNNNILRFNDLLKYFNKAYLIIPFRNPINHANSLLKQHLLHLSLQKKDNFIDEYMEYIGHHEFGKSHRKFNLTNNQKNQYDLTDIRYWLTEWFNYYDYISKFNDFFNKRIIFINYDRIIDEKYVYLNGIEKKLNIKFNRKREIHSSKKINNIDISNLINLPIYKKCVMLEAELKKISLD